LLVRNHLPVRNHLRWRVAFAISDLRFKISDFKAPPANAGGSDKNQINCHPLKQVVADKTAVQ
jgi:hypothetical protein